MKTIKTIFKEVNIGENFSRADGANGMNYDKISNKKAKPCSISGNINPVEFATDLKVWVMRK